MDLLSFYSLFFLLILNSVNSKIIDKDRGICECALHLATDKQIDKPNIRLWEHSIKDFRRTQSCEEAKVLCVNSCKEIVKSELNGLDLQTQPKGLSNALTFGQYICNQIQIDVNSTLVSLFVTLSCNSVHKVSNRIEDESLTFYANFHSNEYLSCKLGIFESRHSLNPIKFYLDSTRIDNSNEMNNWNMFCSAAKSHNNINFKCIDDVIYYFEPKGENWSTARQLCSLKFLGTQFADLVELSDNQQNSVKTMINDILIETKAKTDDSAVDIWTNGICCGKRFSNISNTKQSDCEWISSGKQIEDQLRGATDQYRCTALLVTIRSNINKDIIFNIRGYNEVNSDIKSPYLCTYAKPY